MRYTTDGTFKENLKSTASLYVMVIPHGIAEAVLISLTKYRSTAVVLVVLALAA